MRFQSSIAVAAVAPLLIGAAEPVRLVPVSRWVLNYAEESCRLSRTFGTAADPTVLLFESVSPGSMSMLAIGQPLKATMGAKVTARFLPGGRDEEGESARSVDDKKPAVLWSNVSMMSAALAAQLKAKWEAEKRLAKKGQRPPPINLGERGAVKLQQQAFATAVAGLEIEARRNRPVILETASLGRAMAMLEQCTKDQLRYWGVDPAIEEKIARRVWAPALHHWFKAGDYPRGSINAGEQSVVSFRLLVDAAGRPSKCTTLSHVDAPAFQKVVCDTLMKRARFEPAELADGTKVPSYY
ncbi:MAG: energy transducer TonB, partial [Pseudomonadota bacterium]|nr:energy transducer TonB [Pseudomonadota bacterium]